MAASSRPSPTFVLVLAVLAGGSALGFSFVRPAWQLKSKVQERIGRMRSGYAEGIQAHLPAMRRDLEDLDAEPLFAAGNRRFDAGQILNSAAPIGWPGQDRNENRLGVPSAALAAFEDAATDEEAFAKLEAIDLPRGHFEWLRRMPEFDHWAIERAPQLKDLSSMDVLLKGRIFDVISVTESFKAAAALRLISAARVSKSETAVASREVQALARVLLTTENMLLAIAGQTLLALERAVEKYAQDKALPGVGGLTPVEETRVAALDRLILSSPSVFGPFAAPADVDRISLGRGVNVVDCMAIAENVANRLLYRSLLAKELAPQNDALTTAVERTKGSCRLGRLGEIWADAEFVYELGESDGETPLLLRRGPFKTYLGWLIVSLGNVAAYR